jgi:mono/diheme cytochrome c family protein
VVLLSFVGCGRDRETREWRPEDHQLPSSGTTEEQGPAEPADLSAAAAALYRASCAGCHGVTGQGGGTAAPPGASIPDLTAPSVQDALSDEEMARVIRDGRGMMPAFGAQINDRGIAALVAHVRTVRAE